MEDWQEIFSYKLNKIGKVFDINKVINTPINSKAVSRYYKINKIPYSIIYRGHDAIHLGITYGEIYDRKKDILEQAKIVEKYISNDTKNILELGTGRGINSDYLARKFPNINFIGIDLPGGHINYAIKKSKKLKNFNVRKGDFHDLNSFPANHFDIVFVVEAICYSTDDKKIFREVKRVLKNKGIFIVIDAFADKRNLTEVEEQVKELTEKGMTVPDFTQYEDFRNIAIEAGFKVKDEKDLSKYAMPSMKRVEKYADWFFSWPVFVQKFFVKVFPPEFTNNVLSGYFIKDSIDSGLSKYMEFVFEKI